MLFVSPFTLHLFRYCHCIGSLVRCIIASVLCIVQAGHVLHEMYRLSGEGGKVPSAGQHRCRTGNGVVTAGVSAPVSHPPTYLPSPPPRTPTLFLPFVRPPTHPPIHLSSSSSRPDTLFLPFVHGFITPFPLSKTPDTLFLL